jgi:hypothetical protein
VTYSRKAELRWLGRQSLPMWGGHLERGEPLTSETMQEYLIRGLIEPVSDPCLGYVLTDAGRLWVETE